LSGALDVGALKKLDEAFKSAQRRERTPDWNAQVNSSYLPTSNYTLVSQPVTSMSYNAGALMNANQT